MPISVPVLLLVADWSVFRRDLLHLSVPFSVRKSGPLTILDDQFNSILMQQGMLHFLNHEWTQINANFSRGSSRCDEVIFRLSPRFHLLLNLQEVECRE